MKPDFDIHALESVDLDTEEGENAYEEIVKTLIGLFSESPEGKRHLLEDPHMGAFVHHLLRFGVCYLGVSPTLMSVGNMEEILTDLIPRKVVLGSPDEAGDVVPELVAFWEYLKREYSLPNADPILKYLHEIQPTFRAMMNDTSRYGMAKSLFTMGDEGMAPFIEHFNAKQDGLRSDTDRLFRELLVGRGSTSCQSPKENARKKKTKMKRKAAKKSRKANLRKRR